VDEENMKSRQPAKNKVKRPRVICKETRAWLVGELRRRADDARITEKLSGRLGWWAAAQCAEAQEKAFRTAALEIEEDRPVLR
jgi:hypothetical protein